MRALRILAKLLLAPPLMLLAVALLIGLPLGAFALLNFVAGMWASQAAVAMAIYLFGFCVPAGLYQWRRQWSGRPSGVFRLPRVILLAVGAILAIAFGQVVLAGGGADAAFVIFMLAAAALPPLVALALAVHRLGSVTTWRRALAGLLSGSILSVHLTIALSVAAFILVYLLVLPLQLLVAGLVGSRDLEQLFYSPVLVLTLIQVALVAPLVEELTKPIGAIILAKRLRGPAEAFLVGMAGGVGFAIIENLLYEAAGPQLWASVSGLRGIGGVLHPLNAGLVAMGWYGVRKGLPGAWNRLLGFYGLAVGLHALWNGALVVLYSGVGAYFFGTDNWQFDIYGVGRPGAVVTFMLLEAIALWRILFQVTAQLRDSSHAETEPLLGLRLDRPRRMALWATAALLLVVPVAVLYGPAVARYAAIALPFR